MKKTIAYLFAALAIVTAASCTKVEQQISGEESGSGKVITCTFAANDNTTKTTTTDGKTPLWAAGDQIKVYDAGDVSKTAVITLVAYGTAPGENQGVLSENCKFFTYTKPSGLTGALCAIYPASAFKEFSSNDPVINFAGQDGTFGKANICAGKEDAGGTISFKNVGAILKFTSKPAKVRNILVPVAGMKNDYKVDFSSTTPALTSVNASHITEVDLGNGNGPVYIGVPAGEIASGSVFKYRTPSRGVLGTQATTAVKTVETNKVYPLGDITVAGDLSFSVASDKKVYFSKGNLYYNGSAFQFEANQYDYRQYNGKTDDAAVIDGTSTTTPSGTVGSFFWSKTASVAYAESYSESGTTSSDVFFTNSTTTTPKSDFTVNGATGLWRTLSGGSEGEWKYLLDSRTGVTVGSTTNARYAEVKVNSIAGMLIFPDVFTWPGDVTSKPSTFNTYSDTWNDVNYSTTDFKKLESAGCVFLPAAGDRYGAYVDYVGSSGYYWSSTAIYSGFACSLYFYRYNVYPANDCSRSYGRSVRLVSAAQ